MSRRVIRRSADQSRAAVADLLEALLVTEAIAPGRRLMVISAWITDFPIIDNRAGQFTHVDPRWSTSRMRFSDALRTLMARGVVVSLACRSGPSEDEFIERLVSACDADGTRDRLVLQRSAGALRDRGHEKALVGDGWAVHGSMNFTYSGVEINGELITFTTDAVDVATLAAECAPIFGGPGA